LDLQRVSIVAGNGANGQGGSLGQPTSSAGALTAMQGGVGGNANESVDLCNVSSHGDGGSGGVRSCGGGRNPNAGDGGDGGEMDSSCSCFGQCCTGSGCNARPGIAGSHAAYVFGGS